MGDAKINCLLAVGFRHAKSPARFYIAVAVFVDGRERMEVIVAGQKKRHPSEVQ